MRTGFALLLALLATYALASQPGQPLDCSDWVFVEPGLSAASDGEPHYLPARTAIDAEGRILFAQVAPVPTPSCIIGDNLGLALYARTGENEILLGHIPERCGDLLNTFDRVRSDNGHNEWQYPACPFSSTTNASCIASNIHAGELYVIMRSYGEGYSAHPDRYNYSETRVCRISGLTRLLEVVQSFALSSGRVSFRVPAHPEGLAAIDYLDTYWGQITRPLDFSHAQPLQCAYPEHQPHPGEYLAYPDSAPTPAPGSAIYYLTSVSYQGETRAGREAIDGTLHGRDASRLPACVVEQADLR